MLWARPDARTRLAFSLQENLFSFQNLFSLHKRKVMGNERKFIKHENEHKWMVPISNFSYKLKGLQYIYQDFCRPQKAPPTKTTF